MGNIQETVFNAYTGIFILSREVQLGVLERFSSDVTKPLTPKTLVYLINAK